MLDAAAAPPYPATQWHSFVVPAYGRSRHLAECLESLRGQSVASPIIVSTSTPYDGLEALVEGFGATLSVHAPNRGIGHDWNAALSCATTPWVTLAHQDDIYLPSFTERILRLVRSHVDAVLVATGYAERIEPGGTIRRASPSLLVKRMLIEVAFLGREVLVARRAKRRLLRFGCPIACPSVTLHVERTGLRFREDLRVDLDWEAWIRLSAAPGAFAYDRSIQMLHRIHGASETSAGVRAGVRAQEDLMMFESMWPRPVARVLAKAYSLSYEVGA